jgi:hypothetical protein
VSIPLPGGSFAYSLVKDLWGWVSTRLQCGLLRSTFLGAKAWTVDEWHSAAWAEIHFANPDLSRKLEELAPELRKDKEGTPRYEEANRHATALQMSIESDLNDQLVRGKLIARGFREPFTPSAHYLTISRHEWRVLKLDAWSDRVEGGGVSYIGVTIGRAGTKRFFRRAR